MTAERPGGARGGRAGARRRRAARLRRHAAAALVALVALAVLPAAAAAHATLEATFPAAQARLANPPDAVRFRFDEGVDLRADSVKVFDGSGRAVQRGGAFHPGGRQAEVAVGLPFELPDGTYTATYHVVSADSHPVSGGVVFHVGRGGAAGASLATLLRGQTAGPVTATAFSVVRALQFAAIALGLGTLISVLACWIPGLRAVAGGGPRWAGASAVFARRATRLLAVAAIAGVLSALAALALLAAQLQGGSVWSALRPDVLGDLLRTRFGLAWAVGAGLWLVAGAALAVRPSAVPALRPASVGATGLALRRVEPPLRFLLVPLGALAFLPALSGHASVQRPVAVLLPANVAHVAAMAAWLGGIAVLVLALQRAAAELADADGTRLLVAVVGRFSRLAGVAIAVILLTGVVQGIVEVGSVPALVHTAFGRAVLLKVVAFGAIVALGWRNRSRLLPALGRADAGSPHARHLLRRAVTAELAIGVAVLAITGALAGYPPSTAATAAPPALAPVIATGSAKHVNTQIFLGPTHVKMRISPAQAGPVAVDLRVFNHALQRYTETKEVKVTAALPARGIAPIAFRVRRANPSRFAAAGTLPIPGTWRITVTLRVSAFDEYTSHVDVAIR